MAAAKKQPWFKFHTQDWRGDDGLRIVSLAARGLWIEMLAIMHEAPTPGYLVVKNGEPMTTAELAKVASCSEAEATAHLAELEKYAVFSRNRNGIIYSRRMVRDEIKARKSRDNGKMGGNPSLGNKKQNPGWDNPQDKPIEARDQIPEKKSEHGIEDLNEAAAPPPVAGYSLSDAERAMVDAFDEALTTTWGEGAKRPRMAGTDPATARQLVSLGIAPDAFRAACLDVMGKAAVAGRNPPGSLSYCLKAAMERRGAAPVAAAKPVVVQTPADERAERLAAFRRTGLWPKAWGPRPDEPATAPRAVAAKGA